VESHEPGGPEFRERETSGGGRKEGLGALDGEVVLSLGLVLAKQWRRVR
jgi:hypothetical protein